MQLSFFGGAQTVTGSKHMITLNNGTRILLDCGMFQGLHHHERNNNFMFNPSSVNYLILSHAHIDHCGLIPRLVQQGFNGPIFCTPPTLELATLLLQDSAGLQEADAKNGGAAKPLYTAEDVKHSLSLFQTVPYDKQFEIDDHVSLYFTDAGHILGSAVVNLTIREEGNVRTLSFTGDIGRFSNRILQPPQEFPQAEIILCESTYGDSLHADISNSEEKLLRMVEHTCVEKQGKLLIPAFSIGRTQELIFSLNKLSEEGRLPSIDVFVDSPLSVYATDITRSHADYFNADMQEFIRTDPDPFGFDHLHFITEKEDSMKLKDLDKPCVIISSSGMMEGGRIRHHLRNCIGDERNTILITGFCEPSTLGGKILEGAREVQIFDQLFEVKAEVAVMNEYSAHGDYGDLLRLLLRQDKHAVKNIFLVHGEKKTLEAFKNTLTSHGFKGVEIAEYRMSYDV
jgi:metallo-beta-lactamase family protein